MKYVSTRGLATELDFEDVVLEGLAARTCVIVVRRSRDVFLGGGDATGAGVVVLHSLRPPPSARQGIHVAANRVVLVRFVAPPPCTCRGTGGGLIAARIVGEGPRRRVRRLLHPLPKPRVL